MSFGIAHFNAEDANSKKVQTTAARTSANLFTKYTLDKWSLGGGLNYKSEAYKNEAAGRISLSILKILRNKKWLINSRFLLEMWISLSLFTCCLDLSKHVLIFRLKWPYIGFKLLCYLGSLSLLGCADIGSVLTSTDPSHS